MKSRASVINRNSIPYPSLLASLGPCLTEGQNPLTVLVAAFPGLSPLHGSVLPYGPYPDPSEPQFW
jgi:hypothetical protein